MCLLCIELSDFVFAVDSIPAVLGVSKVVQQSSVCAATMTDPSARFTSTHPMTNRPL